MKKGWQTKQLGELAELKGRIGWRGLTAKEYTKEGPLFLSVHSLNYGDYVDFRDAFHISEERYVESPEIMLQPNDVLICKDGAGIGKLGILGELPDRATINSSLLLIRSGRQILPKYLYRCLTSPYFQDIVQSRLNGATTPHLYQRDITEFPVVLPPLAEQQRIVGLLDEAFEGLATAKANSEKNLQNARALFESHLQSVFTQRGPGWVDSTIGAEIKFIDYRGKTPVKTTSGVRLITAKNVKMGYLQETPMEFIAAASYKGWMTRGIPQKGDVLFTTEAPLANVAQLDTEEKVAFAQRIIIMQPNAARLDTTFLKYLLLSEPLQQSIRTKGTGATVQGIKASLLKLIEISFPKSLTAQEEIVDKLDSLTEATQHLARIYSQHLAALEALKKSLLHQAFAGAL
ncbi:MAG: restriction endonuclease subunit S [Verrucomicrobia bacterium]|nr:restriction endonuclease subunit S [Verrucomicrobiota bacterium]